MYRDMHIHIVIHVLCARYASYTHFVVQCISINKNWQGGLRSALCTFNSHFRPPSSGRPFGPTKYNKIWNTIRFSIFEFRFSNFDFRIPIFDLLIWSKFLRKCNKLWGKIGAFLLWYKSASCVTISLSLLSDRFSLVYIYIYVYERSPKPLLKKQIRARTFDSTF